MPRSFTEQEKDNIRNALIAECKKSWSLLGYKKTSVSELCAAVGISTGAFYAFFDSKEALFMATMESFQHSTLQMFKEILNPATKENLCVALKKLYQEYAENDIITKRHTPDYKALLNKLPAEWLAQHRANSEKNMVHSFFAPGLKLKKSKDDVHKILDTLLLTVANKEMHDNHYEIFCLLLDCVIHELYE